MATISSDIMLFREYKETYLCLSYLDSLCRRQPTSNVNSFSEKAEHQVSERGNVHNIPEIPAR